MRTWRVGTFSMGASLLFLGLCLFFSRILGLDLVHVMTAWWPIILVVLGCEILLYLFLSKQEKPILKYDFLSIFFVGVIGTTGIIFAVLSTTGILGKVEEVVARVDQSFELPQYSHSKDESIKRVVVKTVGYQSLTVETTKEKEVSMFGTYELQTEKKDKLIKTANDYVAETKQGDTLYLNLKTLPNAIGPFDAHESINATLLIPDDVKLEVIGSDNSITLKPRTLGNDWSVDRASSIDIDVAAKSNLKVAAVGAEELKGKDGEWKVSGKPNPDGPALRNAVYQSGEGKYHINIANTYNVSLNTNE